LALAAPIFAAQQPDFFLGGRPAVPAAPDPAIARTLTTIQAARIQQTIETLVRFGTRNTLSSMETDLPPGQAIQAAADWIAAQFEAISKDCYLRGGDHSSFNHEGFAAARFTEWREDFNHQHQNVVLPPHVELTVPVSKDNVVFGVRAVDATGHRSLVVVP
jgi:hypothetical protein